MSFREFYNFYDLERNDEWHFTNDPAGYEVSTTKFDPKTISRGAIEQTGTTSRAKLSITFPADDPFVHTIKDRLDDSRITMSIWRQIFDRLEDDLALINDTVVLFAVNITGRRQLAALDPPIQLIDRIKPEFVNIAKHFATIARKRNITIHLGLGYYYYATVAEYDPANPPATYPFATINLVLPGSDDFMTEGTAIDTFFTGIPTPLTLPATPPSSALWSVSPMTLDYFIANNLGADADNYAFYIESQYYNDTAASGSNLAIDERAKYETARTGLQRLQGGFLTTDTRELKPIHMSTVHLSTIFSDKYGSYMRSRPRLFFPTLFQATLFDDVGYAGIYEAVITPFLDISRIWTGTLTGIAAADVNVSLQFDSGTSAERKFSPRRIIDVRCSHILYDRNTCGVRPSLFKTSLLFAQSTIRTGRLIHFIADPKRPDDYLSLGYIEADFHDGSKFQTFIYYHVETTIPGTSDTNLYTRLTLATDLPEGVANITAYAGCNKRFKTCVEKFNNPRYFGGFPWMPTTTARELLLGDIKPGTEIT